jgi:hypothetical protein
MIGRMDRPLMGAGVCAAALVAASKGDSASTRRADSLLLAAQKDAAAKGVQCSFGAVPLREVG